MTASRLHTLAASILLAACAARGEVILQYFEADWDEIYRRLPEIGEIGYDGMWTPSPAKSPVAGNIPWANVGYSLYDRFDLGEVPQRGTVRTRYGTRGDLRRMVDHAHFSDIKVYPDIVFNHNGNGPNMFTYPGMRINDFHAWADGSQPGGWRRAPRMTAYDDINNGNGGTFQQELVSLIDIVTEPDGRFGTTEPAPFVRHPGQHDKYPFHPTGTPLPNENVREMLNRWAHWLGNAMDHDGFRLDAAKHVVREFYGPRGSGFLHEAQWNFDQRRGFSHDPAVPTLYQNDTRRSDMLMFAEIFTGSAGTFDYWRNGDVRMRYLDFPQKQSIVGDAFSSGNLGALASIGTALDPTEGVGFVQSHDQGGPARLELAHAWLLTHVGLPVVYFSGNNIAWSEYNTKTWVLPGIGAALGDYNGVVANLVYIHNQFARGREWGRWNENDYFAYERYTDLNGNGRADQPADTGEATLLVALNDSGFDQTRTLATSFPNGTVLKDYTGNNPDLVTVAGGNATVRVPARGGQGFVCYAPFNATASGAPIRFTEGGNAAGAIAWVVPGGRDAAAKPRTVPRLSGASADIEVWMNDPVGGAVGDVVVKWGQGRDLNAGAADFGGTDPVKGGFEQATLVSPGRWRLTADLTGVPEGLHLVKGRVFNHRPGLPAIFQTFHQAVYVDRRGPDLTLENLATAETIPGDRVLTILNPDKTAGRIEVSVNGGAYAPATEWIKGTWKFTLTGLPAGPHSLTVRATEHDVGSPPAEINSSTLARSFSVNRSGPALALNHGEGAAIHLPFFKTSLTAPGLSAADVKLFWNGYEMPALTGTGPFEHIFDGRYLTGGVTERLHGAFCNGSHFFEARAVSAGVTTVVARTVNFNLYGGNQTDSDGDGLPDDVELPGFTGGLPPNQTHPGDTNQDMIPNHGENWSRTNPLNHDTFYDGSWDGDDDWDGDGYSNLCEVRQGFLEHGNAHHYGIYDAASKPSTCSAASSVPAQITLNPASPNRCAGSTVTFTYRPNEGPLAAANPVRIGIAGAGLFTMSPVNAGEWQYTHAVNTAATQVVYWFQDSAGGLFDNNGGANHAVALAPCLAGASPRFSMDGLFDSPHYEVANSGMKILAAVRGNQLYVATWSPAGGGSDHFVLVGDRFDPSEASPWAKAGKVYFAKATQPYLAGESSSAFKSFTNAGTLGRSARGAGGQALEGEFNLEEVFGSVPEVVYITAVAYGTSDGGTLASQCPPVWNANNDIEIMEMQPVRVASIRDEDADGHFDGGKPSLQTIVGGDTADANHGLRRFFINELAGESASITVRLYPGVAPGDTVTDAEVFTNLNRRDFAVLEEDPATVSTISPSTYYKAHAMSPIAGGGFEATLPVNRCGAYRVNARYRVNGGPHVYYTDHALRRDCAVVVSPSKALSQVMYEVNPATAEATADTFAGRSTFRDLHTANTDRPDFLNLAHYAALGVNLIWLQPIHPIGTEARETDASTGAPYEPGSPYAVRDYWSVAPALSASNTAAAAMAEFVDFVQALDGAGVGVMMDGTFNHSAPDAVIGQGAVDLFPAWASDPGALIRAVRPGWYARAGRPDLQASYHNSSQDNDIAVAPDRIDFGKWNDVREFHFGVYDSLVKGETDANRDEFLSERDEFLGHNALTREVWEYFAHYPLYWLEKTGHPAGTPRDQSHRGIDGLRCDFAQGLPSEFWEYCINRTRAVKWDFLFMAESLDGYREVAGSKRHGVGYRSARHFDILNENMVFYWRDQFFSYFNYGAANPATFPTWKAFDDRRDAFDNAPLLLNLTGHDEILPHDDPYRVLYAHASLSAMDGVPMVFFGQEAGLQNNAAHYTGRGINPQRNFARYELNFGKSIPHFKRWNQMQSVWNNRDWALQGFYGRIARARLGSPALRGGSNYFLSRADTGAYDPDIFAVAKLESPGVNANQQDVVLVFVNNNFAASSNRSATFRLNAATPGGANWFGIQPGASYNLRNLLSATPNANVWGTDRTGADLIANGIGVVLNQAANTLGQAQYLRLVDTGSARPDNDGDGLWDYTDWDDDNDGLPDAWEIQFGLNPLSAAGDNGAAGDPDGDGMSNMEELVAGTDPNDGNSMLRLSLTDVPGTTVQVQWPSVEGKRYQLLRSPTPRSAAHWAPVFDGTASGSSTQRLDPEPAGESRQYYRVRAVP